MSISAVVPPMRVVTYRQRPTLSQMIVAFSDLLVGLSRWYVWGLLGWQDIRQRYRRSLIGPFWITLSTAIMIGSIGLIYPSLFKIEIADYLPFLTLGLIIWGLISSIITDGCSAFVVAAGVIKQVELPLSLHVYRVLWRNVIIFAHNFVVFVIVAVIFSVRPSLTWLLAVPGLVLLCLNGMWLALILGIVSARFRDLPQIVASAVQVAFFVTPVIWKPGLVPDREAILYLNPFFHFMEIVRAPLLNEVPPLSSWIAALVITATGWLVMLAIFGRYGRHVAFWV